MIARRGFWDGITPSEVKQMADFYRRYRCQFDYPGECNRETEQGHTHTVYGQSGEYIVVWNSDGEIVRDDRPWQMTT